MFIRSFKFITLSAAAYLALPFGIATAEEADSASATEESRSAELQSPETQQGRCNYGDPNLQYVSKNPAECATIQFTCLPGYERFDSECGCGCRPSAP